MARAERGRAPADARGRKVTLLADAYNNLESALEMTDLENEPELADLIIEAVEATDEAYSLETDGVEAERRRSR